MTAPRVLLITESTQRPELFATRLPPTGLLALAAYLEAHGIAADIADGTVGPVTPCCTAAYSVFGLTVNCANITGSLTRMTWLRQQHPQARIIAGGPLPSAAPEAFLARGCDAVAAGEAEEALLAYVRGEPPERIPGLWLRDGQGAVHQPAGPAVPLADLDNLPLPALAKVPLDRYDAVVRKYRPISIIMTSRGCPFRCSFCYQLPGTSWRAHSPQRVVAELARQQHEFGVREVCVFDDNFSLDLDRAKNICRGIIAAGLNLALQTTNGLRADHIDEELFVLMRQAGFWKVEFAAESGNEATLARCNKQIDRQAVANAVRLARQVGLCTQAYYMVGFPWESRADIERTISWADAVDADLSQFACVTAFPGTALYQELAAAGVAPSLFDETGVFYGVPRFPLAQVTPAEVGTLIRHAYRRVQYSPRRLARLARCVPPAALWGLARYAWHTRNL